ncbi:hypothetical protein BDA96_09G084900, partial [Sorghum bicolor]
NRAYAAAVAVCSAAVLLLLASTAMELSTVVKATDRAGVEQTSNLMPVHHEGAREDIKPGVHRRATEERKKVGSDWGKAKVLDDDDKDHSDSGSDSDL